MNNMKKLTPIFVVERIEPCLEFWVDRLGFQKTVEIPEGGSIGFVLLVSGGLEVMYQSRESLKKDMPGLGEASRESGFANATYIEVADIDEVARRLAGWEIVVPRRTTFYGAAEFGVREPAGNLIVFAQMNRAEETGSQGG